MAEKKRGKKLMLERRMFTGAKGWELRRPNIVPLPAYQPDRDRPFAVSRRYHWRGDQLFPTKGQWSIICLELGIAASAERYTSRASAVDEILSADAATMEQWKAYAQERLAFWHTKQLGD